MGEDLQHRHGDPTTQLAVKVAIDLGGSGIRGEIVHSLFQRDRDVIPTLWAFACHGASFREHDLRRDAVLCVPLPRRLDNSPSQTSTRALNAAGHPFVSQLDAFVPFLTFLPCFASKKWDSADLLGRPPLFRAQAGSSWAQSQAQTQRPRICLFNILSATSLMSSSLNLLVTSLSSFRSLVMANLTSLGMSRCVAIMP